MVVNAIASFRSILADWNLDELEVEEGSVYGLTTDLRLGLVTGGWERFARDNGGEEVLSTFIPGTSIEPALEGPLAQFYREAYARCLSEHRIWRHEYECSSPEELRRFLMTTYPLEEGLLIVNTLLQTAPSEHAPSDDDVASPGDFVHNGLMTQCAHCRRFRRADEATATVEGTWRWVGPWVAEPPADISHGLCVPCLEYHYPSRRPA